MSVDLLSLSPNGRGYLNRVVEGLVASGWTVAEIPASAQLPVNRLRLILRTGTTEYRYRVLAYAVGSSARGQPHERRVEITSTYMKGNLPRLPLYRDVILGCDRDRGVFVGIDAKRLEHGGPT